MQDISYANEKSSNYDSPGRSYKSGRTWVVYEINAIKSLLKQSIDCRRQVTYTLYEIEEEEATKKINHVEDEKKQIHWVTFVHNIILQLFSIVFS